MLFCVVGARWTAHIHSGYLTYFNHLPLQWADYKLPAKHSVTWANLSLTYWPLEYLHCLWLCDCAAHRVDHIHISLHIFAFYNRKGKRGDEAGLAVWLTNKHVSEKADKKNKDSRQRGPQCQWGRTTAEKNTVNSATHCHRPEFHIKHNKANANRRRLRKKTGLTARGPAERHTAQPQRPNHSAGHGSTGQLLTLTDTASSASQGDMLWTKTPRL